jgi:hypothetical protein
MLSDPDLNAVEQTAGETRERIVAIKDLMNKRAELVRKKASKVYSKDLVEAVFNQPYSKIKFLEDAGIGEPANHFSLSQGAGETGVLRGIKRGREL